MKKSIKLFEPHIDSADVNQTISVLKSKFWASGSGINKVKTFENNFSKFVGSKDCISVSNGSAALTLALSIFDIKNKEVLVPSMTFVSTVNAIIENGGKPVFCEVNEKNLCVSIDDIEKKISKKTGLILPVHFGGMPCDLKNLKKLSENFQVPIVEDAAHACGAIFNKKRIGSHSDLVCFSFHPVKNLSMPTGGAICINSKKKNLSKILRAKRWCGIENRLGYDYDVKRLGWNYYMNEISAAIGINQLKKLNRLNKIRQKIAKKYYKQINLESKMPFDQNCSFHLYWLIVKNRTKFMKKMKDVGIETGIHYHPVHKMTLYKKLKSYLPITEKISKQIVSIPMHPNLTDSQVQFVIDSINKNL